MWTSVMLPACICQLTASLLKCPPAIHHAVLYHCSLAAFCTMLSSCRVVVSRSCAHYTSLFCRVAFRDIPVGTCSSLLAFLVAIHAEANRAHTRPHHPLLRVSCRACQARPMLHPGCSRSSFSNMVVSPDCWVTWKSPKLPQSARLHHL